MIVCDVPRDCRCLDNSSTIIPGMISANSGLRGNSNRVCIVIKCRGYEESTRG